MATIFVWFENMERVNVFLPIIKLFLVDKLLLYLHTFHTCKRFT